MPCLRPVRGWRSREPNPSGKFGLVFKHPGVKPDYVPIEVKVPCGQCIGCRIDRSRQWAIRCVHEASLHDDNCFITLTYNDENLPYDRSLNKKHFQLFMKKLRKKYGTKIKYFHCGEYGEQHFRPHYHACIFNFDFKDKVHFKTINGYKLYTSDSLSELWPMGFATIGDVTFQSAAYVARYIMKKVSGPRAEEHYLRPNADGQLRPVEKEYITMSRRPGLAQGWFEKYSDDVFPCDFVVIDGKKHKVPRYYDKLLEIEAPELLSEIKEERRNAGEKHKENNTPDRLHVREQVQRAKLNLLPRTLERAD